MTTPLDRLEAVLAADGVSLSEADRKIRIAVNLAPSLLAVVKAARDGAHGTCTCKAMVEEGPRPIGGGRFYHYTGCDFDEELTAALDNLHSAITQEVGE